MNITPTTKPQAACARSLSVHARKRTQAFSPLREHNDMFVSSFCPGEFHHINPNNLEYTLNKYGVKQGLVHSTRRIHNSTLWTGRTVSDNISIHSLPPPMVGQCFVKPLSREVPCHRATVVFLHDPLSQLSRNHTPLTISTF